MIRSTHSIETVDGRENHVKQMKHVASTPGLQRGNFEKAIADANDDYALAVRYGRAVAAVDKNGQLYEQPEAPDEDDDGNVPVYDTVTSGVHPRITDYVTGSAPANKRIGNVIIPCGVCAIVALGGEGKTPLAHALAAYGTESYSLVRVGEPLAGYTDEDDAAAFGLAQALASSSDVVLDSVKDLLGSGGNLMKSGISRDLLASLSSWSTTGCETGTTVFVPINPSVEDQAVVDMLVSSTQSNATMAIVKRGNRWEFWARQGEGLPRTHGFIDMTFDKAGNATITADADKGSSVNNDAHPDKPLTARVTAEALSDSVRRAMILQDES